MLDLSAELETGFVTIIGELGRESLQA